MKSQPGHWPSTESPQLPQHSMWLLDAKSFQLVYFHEPPGKEPVGRPGTSGYRPWTGKYAILSHTWEDDEVGFEDIQDLSSAQTKKGFKKIELACRQALEHKLQYVWIDTCCIDKHSSAELSEAINSMFEWYRKSNVCYAYLFDMDIDVNDDGSSAVGQTSSGPYDLALGRLRKCRWFTRGWTLQELIAPRRVLFFDRHWRYFGTRSGLSQILALITGIDIGILQDDIVILRELDRHSVAKRMSWAAGRQTSRVEDVAYCLLGLFGINMPLLYGEEDKAILRLQEAIMQTTTDHSILLHEGDPGPLARSPQDFRSKAVNLNGSLVSLSTSRHRPLQPTVDGLRVTLPTVVRNDETFAIFGCRYEGDFTGQVGKKIVRTKNDGPRLGDVTEMPVEVRFAPHFAPADTPANLAVFTTQEIAQAKQQTLLFARRPWYQPLDPSRIFQQGISVWFQSDAEFSKIFAHSRAWPKDNWRESSTTMHWNLMDPFRTAEEPYKGHLLWYSERESMWLSLLFRVDYTVTEKSSGPSRLSMAQWYQKQYSLRLFWNTSKPPVSSLEELYSEDNIIDGWSTLTVRRSNHSSFGGQTSEETSSIMLKTSENGMIEMSMEEQEILEASVCVVKLRFIPSPVQAIELAPI